MCASHTDRCLTKPPVCQSCTCFSCRAGPVSLQLWPHHSSSCKQEKAPMSLTPLAQATPPSWLFKSAVSAVIMKMKSHHCPCRTAEPNSTSCIDQTQTALLPSRPGVRPRCCVRCVVWQRTAAVPHSFCTVLGNQHNSGARRWCYFGPSERCLDVQRERLVRQLVTGGNARQLVQHSLSDKSLSYVPHTAPKRREGKPVESNTDSTGEQSSGVHRTARALFWVSRSFLTEKSCSKKRLAK